MEIKLDTSKGATIISPQGRLDFAAAASFQQQLQSAITGAGTPPSAVIIDCTALNYVSSAGLRSFLVAARSAQSNGVAFSVCSLQKSVREVFDVSGFSRIIAAHPDCNAALSSLTDASPPSS